MMAGLLLDALLVLVVVLYVPIGAWRGGPREVLLGGALLLGAATADAVAPRWGDALADVGGTSEGTGRFVVAVAVLLVVGLGIGYGAGAAAGRGTPGLESRVAGGLVGGVNALLLLSVGLLLLQRYFHGGRSNETVEAGWFAETLTEHQGWVFGLAAIVAAMLVAAVRMSERNRDDLLEPAVTETSTSPRRRLVVAPPLDPDSGKVEPVPPRWDELDPAARQRGLAAGTRTIASGPAISGSRSTNDRGAPDRFGNGRGARTDALDAHGERADGGRSVVDEWLRRAADQPLSARAGDASPSQWDYGESVPTGGGSAPFTDAALSNLLDPAARSPRSSLPKVDPLGGMLPRVVGDSSTDRDPAVEASMEAGGFDPITRCPTCLLSVATGLPTCPFCGGVL